MPPIFVSVENNCVIAAFYGSCIRIGEIIVLIHFEIPSKPLERVG